MKNLLFVSFFCGLFAACSSSKTITFEGSVFEPFWTSELMDSVKKNDFRLLIATPKADITGICIVKQVNGEWKGAVINEFGLKVFDFASTHRNCELLNVIPFLNKRYIKKTIAADLQFILEIDNPLYPIGTQADRYWNQDTLIVRYKHEKELQRYPNGEVKYTNSKRNLTYSLTKIKANP